MLFLEQSQAETRELSAMSQNDERWLFQTSAAP